eukprot:CAMPEP_0113912734 /NCGR_PEP_ID=MMETSP0780_2-20120614/29112_1 /TAXON_ID=652834 /ORGANISM="Palpitomonas bilix" /LENGTH=80 /DNA_ID=CAMNT_0000909767 /DNA_START=12 /DNA_END=251 /DNA_ORIENTATION=- /assembly_acc=CAM_ASM_000599
MEVDDRKRRRPRIRTSRARADSVERERELSLSRQLDSPRNTPDISSATTSNSDKERGGSAHRRITVKQYFPPDVLKLRLQ